MIRFTFGLLFLLTTPAFASAPEEIENAEEFSIPVLQQTKEDRYMVVEEEDSFCILSRSGGGDSGGGFPTEMKNLDDNIYKPKSGSGGYRDEDWVNPYFLESVESIETVVVMEMEENYLGNLSYDVLALLRCENGRGVPLEARRSLLFILSEMRAEALEAGRIKETQRISEIMNLLILREDI